jgi:DNA-binding CsgD family transcriptional regulator
MPPNSRAEDFLFALRASLYVDSREDFARFLRTHLQKVVPHVHLLCGYGELDSQGFRIRSALHFGPGIDGGQVPRAHMKLLSELAAAWRVRRRPFVLMGATEGGGHSDAVFHAVKDIGSAVVGFYCFLDCDQALLSDQTAFELAVPHLHTAFGRVTRSERRGKRRAMAQSLTDREREILQWIAQGKTNHEIATILGRSLFTVKNQVRRILEKFGASSRSEAADAAQALSLLGPLSRSESPPRKGPAEE